MTGARCRRGEAAQSGHAGPAGLGASRPSRPTTQGTRTAPGHLLRVMGAPLTPPESPHPSHPIRVDPIRVIPSESAQRAVRPRPLAKADPGAWRAGRGRRRLLECRRPQGGPGVPPVRAARDPFRPSAERGCPSPGLGHVTRLGPHPDLGVT